MALASIEVIGLDDILGRRAGTLLRAADLADAIDAAVVAMARRGDSIATSDVDDLDRLVVASGRDIGLIPV